MRIRLNTDSAQVVALTVDRLSKEGPLMTKQATRATRKW
jgi:hypothetical protein